MKKIVLAVMWTSMLLSNPAVFPVQSISADVIDHDGKTLKLSGHVIVRHDQGAMTCQQATLTLPGGEESIHRVEHISLAGDIIIDLSDQARLFADHGEIDCVVGTATFSADPPRLVSYISSEAGKRPLKTTGKTLMADIVHDHGYALTSIRGVGTIHIVNITQEAFMHAKGAQ